MLAAALGGVIVVGGDGVEAGEAEAAIDQHGRRQVGRARGEGGDVVARRRNDEAVGLARQQDLDAVRFLLGVLVAAHQQDLIVGLGRQLLDAMHQRGEERVGEVGDDDADGARLLPAQAGGEVIGPVAKLRHRRQHALLAVVGNRAAAGQHVGHRRRRDRGQLRDVADGRGPAGAFAAVVHPCLPASHAHKIVLRISAMAPHVMETGMERRRLAIDGSARRHITGGRPRRISSASATVMRPI